MKSKLEKNNLYLACQFNFLHNCSRWESQICDLSIDMPEKVEGFVNILVEFLTENLDLNHVQIRDVKDQWVGSELIRLYTVHYHLGNCSRIWQFEIMIDSDNDGNNHAQRSYDKLKQNKDRDTLFKNDILTICSNIITNSRVYNWDTLVDFEKLPLVAVTEHSVVTCSDKEIAPFYIPRLRSVESIIGEINSLGDTDGELDLKELTLRLLEM